MSVTWGNRWKSFLSNRRNLKTGGFVVAGVVALYLGAIRPYESVRGIANLRATGLAEYKAEPLGLWKQTRSRAVYRAALGREEEDGMVGGVPGGVPAKLHAMTLSASMSPEAPQNENAENSDRKVVRTSSLELVVQKPGEAAEKIRALAERMGGFLVSSEVRGDQDVSGGSLTVRVPAARYEEARTEIRRLALTVDSEKVEAEDVTRQYVDQAANLRNLKAEETQYLSILKQARTVKDTLEVSEKLGEVRGQIEQQQAEFEALSKQIETVAITVALRTEAEARVLGLNWRPLYQMKLALRDGLDGVATYASSMLAFIFFLPTILLWLATITLGSVLGWRLLRWVGRRWFSRKAAELPAQA